jgi:hypothetical protein
MLSKILLNYIARQRREIKTLEAIVTEQYEEITCLKEEFNVNHNNNLNNPSNT